MPSNTAPNRPPLRQVICITCVLAGSSIAQTALWSEMGGGLGRASQHVGILGQELSAGSGDHVNAGFLAHPLFLNTAPLAQDTSIEANAESLSTTVPGADVDGIVVSGKVVDAPLHGTASFTGTLLTYRPSPGYVGADSMGFQVLDDQGLASDTAWVRITVLPVTALAPRHAKVLFVGNPDIRVNRWMASASLDVSRGGLMLSGNADDGSGLALSALLAGPSDVQVQIFDNLGTLVTSSESVLDRRMFLDLPRTADGRRNLSAHWDLRDGNGRPVAAGVYLWRILIVAQDGQKLETVRKTGVKK